MTTVQQVFDMAIHLMDEQCQERGRTIIDDTKEYRFRTISILNAIMPSLWPYSDNCDRTYPGRPACPPLTIPEDYADPCFDQFLPLDDALSRGLLPYALASHLLAREDPELSQWFALRYEKAFLELRDNIPSCFHPIPMPYGSF